MDGYVDAVVSWFEARTESNGWKELDISQAGDVRFFPLHLTFFLTICVQANFSLISFR